MIPMLGRLALPVLFLALTGCQGWQSSLDPKGPEARELANLFWIFTTVLTIVWVLVMIALGLAMRRRRGEAADPLRVDPARERRMMVTISVAVALTAVTVIGLTFVSYSSQRRLFGPKEDALTIRVTGRQWWWDIRYEDKEPYRTFTTANEIRIPVGQPITVKLNAADVIHSFWVPSLMGKMDLIPGRENELQFVADKPGIYRGQCAEFCGLQHAHMGMLVVVQTKEEFERWREAQIRPAQSPTDPERQKGQEVFLSKPCVMCHSVRGTPAGGRVGPDLTHLASRLTIAAGTLPRSRGTLAAWIVDPHSIKPGVNMPLTKLDPEELHPLVSYLEGLE
jgi:cytochrome c oxidase subunit 2